MGTTRKANVIAVLIQYDTTVPSRHYSPRFNHTSMIYNLRHPVSKIKHVRA
jgi:hypothetical protein